MTKIQVNPVSTSASISPDPPLVRRVKTARIEVNNFARKIYDKRSKKHESNLICIERLLRDDDAKFMIGVIEHCPAFPKILSHILVNSFGWRAKRVDNDKAMKLWDEHDSASVGKSFALFLRKRKTGAIAISAWVGHYPQLSPLLEVEFFSDFMTTIANSLLRDGAYGTVYRVCIGAGLSTLDAVTDISVVRTYTREGLQTEGFALFTMIAINLWTQLVLVVSQYRKKNMNKIAYEVGLSAFFLRPAIDAYRVSTSYSDSNLTFSPMVELILNKGIELSCESIPGCVLQIYVLLNYADQAGQFALFSIAISSLATGYTSALIALDIDVDSDSRDKTPSFYGYIPDDNTKRTQTFFVMTILSCLHNLSRSAGCALLASVDVGLLAVFICAEIGLYLAVKILRKDFFYWVKLEGLLGVLFAFIERVLGKVIVDYSGCIHFRHPYELGGPMFLLSLLWSQGFPFVALVMFSGTRAVEKNYLHVLLALASSYAILAVAFFSLINKNYLRTFFDSTIASSFTAQRYRDAKTDRHKFSVFGVTDKYRKELEEEIKEWVSENITRWSFESEPWYDVTMIEDRFLPEAVYNAVGGARRKRSTVTSLMMKQDEHV